MPAVKSKIFHVLFCSSLVSLSQGAMPNDTPPDPSHIKDFVYQLQNIDLDAIGKTGFDLVVMDYSSDGGDEGRFSADRIETLKSGSSGRKTVLSYLSIGEAEDYRFYWQPGWRPGNPAWLDAQNPDWPGNYKVRYWDPGWQAVVLVYLDKILDAGFDGIYCDIIDAYEYYAGKGRTTAAQDMADFVAVLRAHASIRNPYFLIFVQNAAELAVKVPSYLSALDGIGQEDVYYGYEQDGKATPADVTSVMEKNLKSFRDAGKIVLTVDYPFSFSGDVPHFDAATRTKIESAYARSKANGFVPYCTVRNLNFLTINPGHDPSGIERIASPEGPRAFDLLPNYPNPFNGGTVIPFLLEKPSEVSMKLYNALGREIRVLFEGRAGAGKHECRWDGRDGKGAEAEAGIYLAGLHVEGTQAIRKLLLVR
jgi:cysteinyl-tRNA synthetase, unknown class